MRIFSIVLFLTLTCSCVAQKTFTSQEEMVKELLARGVKGVSTTKGVNQSARSWASRLGYKDSVAFLDEQKVEGRRVGIAQLRDFVYHWFIWFDRREAYSRFARHLSRVSLYLQLPDKEIRGHTGFENWYATFLQRYVHSRHDVGPIHVVLEKTGGYWLEMKVKRRTLTRNGREQSLTEHHSWFVRVGSDRVIRIRRMKVHIVNPTRRSGG